MNEDELKQSISDLLMAQWNEGFDTGAATCIMAIRTLKASMPPEELATLLEETIAEQKVRRSANLH